MRAQTYVSAGLLALALLVTAARVAAQPAQDAEVRVSLIREAAAAHQTGDHQRALELAERASSLGETGTLHGFIARELVELGQVAAALAHVDRCVRDAPAERATVNRDVFLEWCRTQRPTLEHRVARLIIDVPSAPAGLLVEIGGRPLPAALFGVGYLVDSGRVAVTATAPGREPFRVDVDAQGGASVTVPIVLATIAPEAPTTTRTRRPVGLVVAAVGAASLAASAITWAVGGEMCGPEASACPSGCCVESDDQVQSIRALDTATTATLVIGSALTVAGALLYIFLPPAVREEPRVTISVGSGTLGLTGVF